MSHPTLTVDQAAAVLRGSRYMVLRRIAQGDIPAQEDGRRLLVASADLAAYIGRHHPETSPMPDAETLPRLWTLKEVSDETGLPLRSLQQAAREGRIACVKFGKTPRVTRAQYDALIEQFSTSNGDKQDALAATRERVVRQRNRKATRPERAA